MPRLALLTILVVLAPGVLGAQGSADVRVWVNLRSGVYHCPGTEHYGSTSRGEYLRQADALSRGFRANGGRACPAPGDPAVPPDGPPPPDRFTRDCVVAEVTDGDTIRCEGQADAVRLIGIDAPEKDQAHAAEATQALVALVPVGARVRLELDEDPHDRYGRLLAYAWRRGRLVNWAMVRRGFAVPLRVAPNLRHAVALDSAAAWAAREPAGLWRVDGFSCRPAEHRAGRC